MKQILFLFALVLFSLSVQAQTISGTEKFQVKDGDTIWLVTIDEVKDYINLEAGSGTVTSVAITLPSGVFDVSGSPITTTGTLAITFDNQAQNYVFAGPTSGSGAPTFRALVAGDIPNLSTDKLTSGTLPVGRGGTGGTSFTTNALLTGGTSLGVLALGTANQVVGMNSGATANEYKTFAVGTSGVDFAVAHSANTITFNLPVATATIPGKVSASAQAFGGKKTFQDGMVAIGSGTVAAAEIVGAIKYNINTITSNTTLVTDYGYIECDCTSGTVTLTFPDAGAGSEGQTWKIVKIDSSSNPCVLDLDSTDTFLGGGQTKSLYGQGTTAIVELGDTGSNTKIYF